MKKAIANVFSNKKHRHSESDIASQSTQEVCQDPAPNTDESRQHLARFHSRPKLEVVTIHCGSNKKLRKISIDKIKPQCKILYSLVKKPADERRIALPNVTTNELDMYIKYSNMMYAGDDAFPKDKYVPETMAHQLDWQEIAYVAIATEKMQDAVSQKFVEDAITRKGKRVKYLPSNLFGPNVVEEVYSKTAAGSWVRKAFAEVASHSKTFARSFEDKNEFIQDVGKIMQERGSSGVYDEDSDSDGYDVCHTADESPEEMLKYDEEFERLPLYDSDEEEEVGLGKMPQPAPKALAWRKHNQSVQEIKTLKTQHSFSKRTTITTQEGAAYNDLLQRKPSLLENWRDRTSSFSQQEPSSPALRHQPSLSGHQKTFRDAQKMWTQIAQRRTSISQEPKPNSHHRNPSTSRHPSQIPSLDAHLRSAETKPPPSLERRSPVSQRFPASSYRPPPTLDQGDLPSVRRQTSISASQTPPRQLQPSVSQQPQSPSSESSGPYTQDHPSPSPAEQFQSLRPQSSTSQGYIPPHLRHQTSTTHDSPSPTLSQHFQGLRRQASTSQGYIPPQLRHQASTTQTSLHRQLSTASIREPVNALYATSGLRAQFLQAGLLRDEPTPGATALVQHNLRRTDSQVLREQPVRQPRNPVGAEELRRAPTLKHKGSRNFVGLERRESVMGV